MALNLFEDNGCPTIVEHRAPQDNLRDHYS